MRNQFRFTAGVTPDEPGGFQEYRKRITKSIGKNMGGCVL